MNFIFEYIWIGGNRELRTKTKIVKGHTNNDYREYATEWNFDGSSTDQAEGFDSEVILSPKAFYPNPFYKQTDTNKSYLVLCDTYTSDYKPHPTNTRYKANNIFENLVSNKLESMGFEKESISQHDEKPLFGTELEFFVLDNKTGYPLGFNSDGHPLNGKQGPYYCSVGTRNCYGRSFLNLCVDRCIEADLPITGSNMEVACGQMEIQLCSYGISSGDNNLILKYILERTGEEFDYKIDYSAKPIDGDWNGSGCHINFSTEKMRNKNGINFIYEAIEKLKEKHAEHIRVYGVDNAKRLTGLHETSSMDTFSFGVANRGASIRIPNNTIKNNCGYFEDRRPSASCDLYLATSKLFETCCS